MATSSFSYYWKENVECHKVFYFLGISTYMLITMSYQKESGVCYHRKNFYTKVRTISQPHYLFLPHLHLKVLVLRIVTKEVDWLNGVS